MRCEGHVARMGRKSVYRVLVGRIDGKRALGGPRRRREDNIKMNELCFWTLSIVWCLKN
jgi:hypothetical protein